MSTLFSRGLRVVLPFAAILLGGCVRSPARLAAGRASSPVAQFDRKLKQHLGLRDGSFFSSVRRFPDKFFPRNLLQN